MKTIKTLSFIFTIPTYIYSLILFLIFVIGFDWSKGIVGAEVMIPIALLILAGYLLREMAVTNKKLVLLTSALVVFISIFAALAILSSFAK